ncbi:hypothetical protein CJ204_12650 [Corynebacterium xerosis]|uniref:Uncharacterized protein n=1 Tax=Corynebacterium xerosis TaxID=1725 RepID=A0A2N6SVP3_9CORY|nr:hypothetical protein CJ204_12650 [Corynebacterium xerosis]
MQLIPVGRYSRQVTKAEAIGSGACGDLVDDLLADAEVDRCVVWAGDVLIWVRDSQGETF